MRRVGIEKKVRAARPKDTSVGCGSSIVEARLNCLPEVTVHRTRRIG